MKSAFKFLGHICADLLYNIIIIIGVLSAIGMLYIVGVYDTSNIWLWFVAFCVTIVSLLIYEFTRTTC